MRQVYCIPINIIDEEHPSDLYNKVTNDTLAALYDTDLNYKYSVSLVI